MKKSFRKMNLPVFAVSAIALLAGTVFAANIATFQLKINPGTLAVDIVDATYTPVAAPLITFAEIQSSLDCSTTTGTLGTAEQQIYITNPDAARDGYTVAIAPTAGASATWSDGTNTFDFNDETGTGCTGGQLAISGGTITDAKLATDALDNISVVGGSFTTASPSVTLVDAASASADISEVVANGFTLTQKIPARTPASTYSLPMTLTALGK